MISSAALIRDPFQPGQPEYDKFFLMAHIEERSRSVVVHIRSHTPTYAINQNVLNAFDLTTVRLRAPLFARSA